MATTGSGDGDREPAYGRGPNPAGRRKFIGVIVGVILGIFVVLLLIWLLASGTDSSQGAPAAPAGGPAAVVASTAQE